MAEAPGSRLVSGPANHDGHREPSGSGMWCGWAPSPSEVWRSADAGTTWEQTSRLETLPSSSEWSFPPRPDTHHVRWIACHPLEPERLLVAICRPARSCQPPMAAAPGATASLADRGTRTSSPSTAMLPITCASPLAMDTSRATMPARRGARPAPVSRSATCAAWLSIRSKRRSSWYQPRPDRTPCTCAGRSDGRLYRRLAPERWERVRDGFPEPASTIAPLLCTGLKGGELWAADERGVHRSDDGGKSWRREFSYATPPQHLRGLSLIV